MALEPQSQRVVDFVARLGIPDFSETTPEVARRISAMRTENLPKGPDARVAPRTIPGAAGEWDVLVYRPLDADCEVLPVLPWFHGGGFVVGDLAQADADCRQLATDARSVVVSLD